MYQEMLMPSLTEEEFHIRRLKIWYYRAWFYSNQKIRFLMLRTCNFSNYQFICNEWSNQYFMTCDILWSTIFNRLLWRWICGQPRTLPPYSILLISIELTFVRKIWSLKQNNNEFIHRKAAERWWLPQVKLNGLLRNNLFNYVNHSLTLDKINIFIPEMKIKGSKWFATNPSEFSNDVEMISCSIPLVSFWLFLFFDIFLLIEIWGVRRRSLDHHKNI